MRKNYVNRLKTHTHTHSCTETRTHTHTTHTHTYTHTTHAGDGAALTYADGGVLLYVLGQCADLSHMVSIKSPSMPAQNLQVSAYGTHTHTLLLRTVKSFVMK